MQHYKKRNPPWIKLYTELLDDENFEYITDQAKLIFFFLLLFASRKGNKIKNDAKWLNRKLPVEAEIKESHIKELVSAGFLEGYDDASKDDSDMLALVGKNAIPEQRQSKAEKSKEETETTFPSNLDTPEFHTAWKDWLQFRSEIKKQLTPSTIKTQLKTLSKFSVKDAIATIEKSIQNSWQGLFPPDEEKKKEKPKTCYYGKHHKGHMVRKAVPGLTCLVDICERCIQDGKGR